MGPVAFSPVRWYGGTSLTVGFLRVIFDGVSRSNLRARLSYGSTRLDRQAGNTSNSFYVGAMKTDISQASCQ